MAKPTKKSVPAQRPASPPPAPRQTAKTTGTALTVSNRALFEQHSGAGLENVTAKDLIIPRLVIIQGLSPQIIKSKPEYNPDAKVGDIYDVATGEVMPDPLVFLPCYFMKQCLEWFPRASGKGLARIHDDNAILAECRVDDKNKHWLPNGNLVAETSQFFGLNLSADGRRSFIPMASTQIKKGRQWLTLATAEKIERENGTTFTPPLFFRTYHLTSAEESNNDGTWMGWKIARHVPLTELDGWEALFSDAVALRESLMAGEARGDIEHPEGSSDEGGRAGGGEGRM